MKEYRIPNIVDRKWNGRLRKETIIHRLITQSHIYYVQGQVKDVHPCIALYTNCQLVSLVFSSSELQFGTSLD
ncbi:hypothetical protein LINPERPRIM_LOCUS8570 [Linum perenne]